MFKSIIIALVIAITSTSVSAGGSLKFNLNGLHINGGETTSKTKITIAQTKAISKTLSVKVKHVIAIKQAADTTTTNKTTFSFQKSTDFAAFSGSFAVDSRTVGLNMIHKDTGVGISTSINSTYTSFNVNKAFKW